MSNLVENNASSENDDLLQRIKAFLQNQGIPTLRQLVIGVNGDTAVIEGNVSTFYERQMGIECCKRVAGVRTVVDQICVEPRKERSVPEN